MVPNNDGLEPHVPMSARPEFVAMLAASLKKAWVEVAGREAEFVVDQARRNKDVVVINSVAVVATGFGASSPLVNAIFTAKPSGINVYLQIEVLSFDGLKSRVKEQNLGAAIKELVSKGLKSGQAYVENHGALVDAIRHALG